MRVSAFTVEDKDTGKVLVFKGTTMEDLFKAAGEKLGEKEAFTRVFLADGAEVSDPEEIRDDDKLYFSKGTDMQGKKDAAAAASWTATASSAASSAVSSASSYLGHYSALVTEKFPQLKVTLGTVQQSAGGLGPEMKLQLATAKQWADQKFAQGVALAQAQSASFLESDTGKSVNALLQDKIVKPSQVFYSVSVNQFQQLRNQSEEKKVSLEQFVEGLKAKMGENWNENLLEPAKAFYNSAQAEFAKVSSMSPADVVATATAKGSEVVKLTSEAKSKLDTQAQLVYGQVQTQLGESWNTTVTKVMQSPITDQIAVPATFFYQSALDSFTTLQAGAGDSKVSMDEFVGGVKIKLGSLWSDQLAPAATQLYEQFHTKHADSAAASSSEATEEDKKDQLP